MSALPQSTPVRVVVVDDTADLRELLRYALEQHEFTVVGEAADGLTGLEVATRLSPDLVLLDLAMPGTDGFEVLPRLRAACPEAKVVVLSGYPAAAVQDRARDLGADGFVHKGASLHATIRYVREVLEVGTGPAPAAPTAPTGPSLSVVPDPTSTPPPASPAAAGWLAPVPFGVVELDDTPALTVVGSNPAACALLGPALRVGAPLAAASPDLATDLARQRHLDVVRAEVSPGPNPSRATALQVTATRVGERWCVVVNAAPDPAAERAARQRALRPLRPALAQVRETTRRLAVLGVALDETERERQARLVSDLRRHVDRLLELGDGLDPAATRVVAHPRWCDLDDLLAGLAARRPVEVTCRPGTPVLVDPAQLGRLLERLLREDGPSAGRRTTRIRADVREGVLRIDLIDPAEGRPRDLETAHELAAAHGGTVEARPDVAGWTVRIPQPRS